MIGAYIVQRFWKFVFPGDRASPALIAAAVIVNCIVVLSATDAWEDATQGHCTDGTKAWLIAGVINSFVHIIFAIYFVVVIRRRALRCTVVAPDMTVAKFVLHDYGLFAYGCFCVWVVVWMGVTYHHYPLSSSRRVLVANDNLPDSDDSVPYTCDLCCVFCTVISSVNVAYMPLVAFLMASTLVTEGFRQPRWWHTILLQDLRQRELRALYDEERPRSPTRANLNADTDREMRAAGYKVASRPPPEHAHLRYRRPDKKYEAVQSEEMDERRPPPPPPKPTSQAAAVPPAAPKSKTWAPPAAVEQAPPSAAPQPVPRLPGGLVSSIVGRNIAPGAKRRPLHHSREDRQVHFASDDAIQNDLAYWRPPTTQSAPKPVAPRMGSRKPPTEPGVATPQQRTQSPRQEASQVLPPSVRRPESAGFVTTRATAPEERSATSTTAVAAATAAEMNLPRFPTAPPEDDLLFHAALEETTCVPVSHMKVPHPKPMIAMPINSAPPSTSSAYVSSELEKIRALIHAPPAAVDHDALDFEIDSEEEFEIDDNAVEFEIDDE
ncbi:membrane-associated protein, putative [Bodo saltans]|uniref:Membrane-associated protein, putative n=1 Tax=Bodo saltans TaxID=75058 RepID=A0A0S4IX82_BODSA|nr:membrane-associated protein, putative [Bodo saltans]|eukprot:CUF88605.1 membrane-associated protein, putative [Bodo saltans]